MQETKPPKVPCAASCEERLNRLELEYEASRGDPENARALDELRFKIAGLLGKNNLNLLREYTDRLIAQFNVDAGWFYRQGILFGARYVLAPGEGDPSCSSGGRPR